MTDNERIAHLETELATLHAYVRELPAENAARKRRLAQESRNSSKRPPVTSWDGGHVPRGPQVASSRGASQVIRGTRLPWSRAPMW